MKNIQFSASSHAQPISNGAPNKPIFNPFIHGTTSLIFSRLAKTQMQVMSPMEMLTRHHVALPGGEHIGEGLGAIASKSYLKFGMLSENRSNELTLERIIEQSSQSPLRLQSDEQLIQSVRSDLKEAERFAFSNVDILMVHIARAKAKGVSINNIIRETMIDELVVKLEATKQFYYLLLILGKDVHPDFNAISQLSSSEQVNVELAIESHLTFENILKKIINNKLNVKAIYDKPTKRGLEQIADLFVLSENCEVMSKYSTSKHEVTLSLLRPFKIAKLSEVNYQGPSESNRTSASYYFARLSENTQGYSVNSLLKNLVSNAGLINPAYLRQMDRAIHQKIEGINKNISLLKSILEKKNSDTAYTFLEKSFLYDPFPVILISENIKKIKPCSGSIFHAVEPLKIGSDIKLIATDTQKHRLMILRFLREHKINNVKVIFIEQLRESKNTQMKPKSPTVNYGISISKTNILLQSVGLGIVSGCLAYMMITNSLILMAIVGVGVSSIVGFHAYVRDKYLKYAASQYDSVSKIRDVKEPKEKQALLAGIDAANWKGYFSSFTNSATYCHPIAFAAGCSHGVNAIESPIADKIKIHCR